MNSVAEDGSAMPEFSLVSLMEDCVDFKDETTELEAIAERNGATVIITTKYHEELAGEGIEYAWAVSKSLYRSLKLDDKRGK